MLEIHLHFKGLSLRGGGWGFPLATMNVAPGYFHRKIESKEIPSCLIDHLLVVFTRQLEILVTALTSVQTGNHIVKVQLYPFLAEKTGGRELAAILIKSTMHSVCTYQDSQSCAMLFCKDSAPSGRTINKPSRDTMYMQE